MATTDLFPTFTTTGQEAEQQGDQFTQQFGFLQAPAEVKGVGAATKLPRDIGINLKLKTLGREQEEVEDEEAPQDATSRLRKSMIAAGSFSPSPANIFGLSDNLFFNLVPFPPVKISEIVSVTFTVIAALILSTECFATA